MNEELDVQPGLVIDLLVRFLRAEAGKFGFDRALLGLSGGIDSCSTLGMASASQQSAVKAFTIGFDDADYDESVIATEMAHSVGADQDIMRLNASHLYDNLEQTLNKEAAVRQQALYGVLEQASCQVSAPSY